MRSAKAVFATTQLTTS